MRHKEAWRPTKFVVIDGQLRGDPTGIHPSVGSRLLGDLVAPHYQTALKSCAHGRLLDLGCGNAPLFEAYRDMVDEVICVDWPQSLHQQAYVDAFVDLTQPLPFADCSFDTILLSDVLEHIPDPEVLLSEIARVLRPDGSVVIGVPFLYWLHEAPHDFNRYTRYQLERLMRRAGLQLIRLTEVGGSPEVIADVMGKTLATRPRLGAAFVAFAGWMLKRRYIQALSQQTRSQFPLAYLLTARKGN